jgi:pimeloyl-ACP methyl ester carboxylesterase
MAYCRYNGNKIFYEVYGEGEPLLFVHEWSNSSLLFKRLGLRHFNSRYQVIIMDLPGFGKSDPINNLTFDDFSQILKTILDELMIRKVTLMGFCLGAAISLDFTLKYNKHVDNLVLIEPTVIYPAILNFLLIPLIGKVIYNWVTRTKHGFTLFSRIMVGKNSIKSKILHSTVKRSSVPTSYQYLKMLYNNKISGARELALSAIQSKTLLIQGELTLDIFKKNAEYINNSIKNCGEVIIKEGRHFLLVEKPKEVYDSITSYFT